jgi:hypothetical protein
VKTSAWNKIVSALDASDVSNCVEAASRLHADAGIEDVPKLLALLENDSFFVREAAAWPLAELAGPSVLPQLFSAYQRGFDEGHDNDGFTAALLEIPFLFPTETKPSLANLIKIADEKTKGHAQWLLEFCSEGRQE